MQGKNSQRELKVQLSEKSSAAIQALLRIAATVNNDSGSEVRVGKGFFLAAQMMPCQAA